MSEYDFKPSGSLKLKGVKEKKIKKAKKENKEKEKKKVENAVDEEIPTEKHDTGNHVVHKTEAERRFEEIQRQRVEFKAFESTNPICSVGNKDQEKRYQRSSGESGGDE